MENTVALIMAAGKDDKIKSKKSKLLQTILGKEVILRVYEAVKNAGVKDIFVVVGDNEEEIKTVLKDNVIYVKQKDYQGTAVAVKTAKEAIEPRGGRVLVLNGNVPLITKETIEKLVKHSVENEEKATILSGIMSEPNGYGRIVREDNKIKKIVEQFELNEEQNKIIEVNSGIYVFDVKSLYENIEKIEKKSNDKFNITDIVEILENNDEKVGTLIVEDKSEILSLNNKLQLEALTRILRIRINTMHMLNGVTIEDINTTYIYEDVEIGMDTVIYPNTTIKSNVVIGENCNIGPNAYIREGCRLADKVKIGSFVEVKKAIIAEGSKVPHLSYMGDCEIGTKCNIGCGTITCNYDGFNKSKTIIGDHSFIGSNTNLVAPVTVGDNVFIAAGSTITDDVPSDSLAIARQRQVNKEGWNKNK